MLEIWYKTFTNLTAYLTAPVSKVVSEETTYDGAIAASKNLFVKPKNKIYAQHMLATAQQSASESIDEFVLCINKLRIVTLRPFPHSNTKTI